MPNSVTELFAVFVLKKSVVCSGTTFTVRQYVTTMMTSGMKKATKEPISMKRSSLRTQLPLTKTLSSLRRPITGIGIDTPWWGQKGAVMESMFYGLFVFFQASAASHIFEAFQAGC